jgi:FlaA1/EpsC-like NDP-sugar epimerase
LNIGVNDVRPVTEADLLGRHIVDTEIDAIAGYLTGRRVLVTGAGGSIGSELCRQIHRFAPAKLIMLDHAETGLHQVQLSIEGRALLDDRSVVVCDIRDEVALHAAFAEHRPEVVFHAAALKHLPLLEMWPAEAIKTNVIGTQHVLDAAATVGVERFVNISTDKAARPSSVLGYTKRLAERLTSGKGEQAAGTYLSVRFGNVLGSSGSVLRSFRAQIDAGGPVTVTDRNVTRFFMMVEEAVQLVIQAGAIGRAGEVLVLDMGKPVCIAEVAERLIRESRLPIQIAYTGLRPGEKMHEDLFGEGERDVRPVHALISHVPVPSIDFSLVAQLPLRSPARSVKSALLEVCHDTRPLSLSTNGADTATVIHEALRN